jgi:hypothetical protein
MLLIKKNQCRLFLFTLEIVLNGPGSSVGIATGYGLDSPGIELAASVV